MSHAVYVYRVQDARGHVALRLGLFEALAAGALRPEELAQRIGADARGVRLLLENVMATETRGLMRAACGARRAGWAAPAVGCRQCPGAARPARPPDGRRGE